MSHKLRGLHVLYLLAALVIFSASVFAHHGYAAYDMTAIQTVKGTIVNILLLNPHSSIAFDVKDANGNVEHWFSESANPRAMRQDGYTPENIKPGDEVTVYYHPSRSGAHVVVLTKVQFADGRVLPLPHKGTNDAGQ